MIEIKFYKKNGQVNAYIGGESWSGIEVNATNVNELIENLKVYLLDMAEEELNGEWRE